MQQAKLWRGLLCVLVLGLGLWLGCAGRGDWIYANSGDGGTGDDGTNALDTAADVRQYPISCKNGNKDTGETDYDCGGNCPTCGSGKNCANDLDCSSGDCNTSFKCK
jgi:hypothetical protein